MSNYSQIVLYGPKDSLSHGDPNKLVKGTQLDAEFSAISSAISSKQDTSTAVMSTSGSFTVTLSGMTGTTTGTMFYTKVGNLVNLWVETSITGTSNASSLIVSGLAPTVAPAVNKGAMTVVLDNNNLIPAGVSISPGGSISFIVSSPNFSANGFTSSGVKGLHSSWFGLTYSTAS